MNQPFKPSNRMKIMIRRKEIVRQAIAAETLEEETRLDAIARTSASLEGNNGCDLNLILLQGNRKTILVELIPKLTPPSWS